MRKPTTIVITGAIPAYAVAIAVIVIGTSASFALMPWPGGLVGTAASLGAALFPRRFGAWLLILLMAGSLFLHPFAADDGRPYAVLFAVHALHTMTRLIAVVPIRTRITAPMWRTLLRRFVVSQVCAQLVLLTASSLSVWLRSAFGGWPWLAPLSAALLITLFALLLRSPRTPEAGIRLFPRPRGDETVRAQHDVGEDS